MKDSYCSYCGHQFESRQYPLHCGNCKNITWRNPLPVVVLLVPVGYGMLICKRGIEPGIGEWALPGGYLELGETWQEGGARELKEEVSLDVSSKAIKLEGVISSTDGHILVFGSTPVQSPDMLKSFTPNTEVPEIKIEHKPIKLAFSSHTRMMEKFLLTGTW